MPAPPVLPVPVRAVVDFVHRSGDLGALSGVDRGAAGTRGHQAVAAARPTGWRAEVPLTLDRDGGGFTLRLQGRADGVLDDGRGGVVVEEVKTFSGDLEELGDGLRRHWAQAELYALMYLAQEAPDAAGATLQLAYHHLPSGRTHTLRRDVDRPTLEALADDTLDRYSAWLARVFAWQRTRDESIATLPWPYGALRPGQEELRSAVARALAGGARLFAQAPTGIGKTQAALWPAVRALGAGTARMLFWLTARTTGRLAAEAALRDLRSVGLRLRAVSLTAKAALCPCLAGGPGEPPCDPDVCGRARGHEDRVGAALEETLGREELTAEALLEVAERHQVCPFELQLDAASWADLVVGDYNYVFDPRVRLRRFFDGPAWAYALLVDEAHQLPDRAREMFGAAFTTDDLSAARRAAKGRAAAATRALTKAGKALRELAQGAAEAGGARCDEEPPSALVAALAAFAEACEAPLSVPGGGPARADLLRAYFAARAFTRAAEGFDGHFATLTEVRGRVASARILCLDASGRLRARLDHARAAVLWSATLAPLNRWERDLGGSSADEVLDLPCPFPPENRLVLLADGVDTTFHGRARTHEQVAELVAALADARRGNYLVYLPSYAYLQEILLRFRLRRPWTRTLAQTPRMSPRERGAFLDAFAADQDETLVGFAVLGGPFGEGIDLVGERLSGAVVVGVGLPQVGPEREALRAWHDREGHDGFEHAYVHPGMARVLQAAGRVIRSERDRGVILLVDRRYAHEPWSLLLPPPWSPEPVADGADVAAAAARFWG